MRCIGFTLIELLIAILIVAVLAAVGYPAYTSQLEYGRRTEAQRLLLDSANALERSYAADGVYPSTFTPVNTDYYQLSYSVAEDKLTYLLSATPNNSSANCGSLTLNQSGATTPTTANCWK
jgi:type IV pilus assembly protein PilE